MTAFHPARIVLAALLGLAGPLAQGAPAYTVDDLKQGEWEVGSRTVFDKSAGLEDKVVPPLSSMCLNLALELSREKLLNANPGCVTTVLSRPDEDLAYEISCPATRRDVAAEVHYVVHVDSPELATMVGRRDNHISTLTMRRRGDCKAVARPAP